MYNFLLIEDSVDDTNAFLDTVKRLNIEAKEERYHLDTAATYTIGMEKASGNLNGIIVDVKLDGDHSGNEIIREIINKYRVPVVIFTGTPDTEQDDASPIKVYKKGEARHEEILNELCTVSETGLFNVLGRTGIIEQAMTQVFWNNLYPQIGLWKTKKNKGIDTEKVLLRYAISHIQELIDNEVPSYETEEMYIKPPISKEIKTGSIYQSSKEGFLCIVLSPPCDLAKHGDSIKTDRILVCEIDDQDTINDDIASKYTKRKDKKSGIQSAIKNNYADYFHWLPHNALFKGGYINFRKVLTYPPNDSLKNLINQR